MNVIDFLKKDYLISVCIAGRYIKELQVVNINDNEITAEGYFSVNGSYVYQKIVLSRNDQEMINEVEFWNNDYSVCLSFLGGENDWEIRKDNGLLIVEADNVDQSVSECLSDLSKECKILGIEL